MKETTFLGYQQRMLRVLVHIQQNLESDLGLDELADIAAFSPFHFHRIFRGMVGETVSDHVRRLRLERAATRLKLSGKTITEIAFEAGYQSHEGFSRAFKAQLGVSPSAFRIQVGPGNPSCSPSGIHFREGEMPGGFEPMSGSGHLEAQIVSRPSLRLAFVRHTGPYSECGRAWDTLGMWLGKEGLVGSDTEFIGLCHDDPELTTPERLRYDACSTVPEGFRPKGPIGLLDLEGGEFAQTTHFGPFELLGATYAELLGVWLPRSGRELRSIPCLEVYLTDPDSTDPEDYVTDIYAPIE